MFRKEATYIFEFSESREPFKYDVYVDKYSGRRYFSPTIYYGYLDYLGTGDEYKEIKAELLHTGEPRISGINTEDTEYLFRLPDVNQYAFISTMVGGEFDYDDIFITFLPAIPGSLTPPQKTNE